MRRIGLKASLLVIAVGIGVVAGPRLAARQRETRERRVVLTVLERGGKIATGLTPADFSVREDGVAREVTKVEQSAAPMQVAVLVDTSTDMQLSLRDARLGVETFARSVWTHNADTDVSLMEFGERPAHLVPATKSAVALKTGLDRLVERPGSGAYLLDAVVEAATGLKGRRAARPVIVVLSRDSSPEFSTRQSGAIETAIRSAQAQLWALVLRDREPALSDETRQRDIVLGDVSARSGGTREVLLDRMQIQAQFAQLADRLAAQYVVTYGRPESLIPPNKLEVTTKRAGARVLAPRWTGQ